MRPNAKTGRRLFILSLDGVPHSFLANGVATGRFPNLARLGKQVEIRSTLPAVSSVAWATFSTGVNPGNHGIFGFIDRDPQTLAERIPSSRDLASPSLWEMLNAQGKKTIAINVPLTYPPLDVDGIMVSCFLCTDLARGVTPRSLLPRLKDLDYRIDPDPALAPTDRAAYFDEILATFRSRRRALLDLFQEPWDLFMCHVMMTDRVNHFFWKDGHNPESPFYQRFWDFYQEVDDLVGEVDRLLPAGVEFLLLSDHGFCELKQEVDLNAALAQGRLLSYTRGGTGLRAIAESAAYSLLPGRVYVHSNGGGPSRAVCDQASDLLTRLCDAEGNTVLEKVLPRKEAYSGKCVESGPDLVALPHPGFDLKGRFTPGPIFSAASTRSGMHTVDDAFALVRGRALRPGGSILDATPTVFELMGLPVPGHLEGRSLLENGSLR